MAEQNILILAGGNALGAYQGGAYETIHERGFHPDQVFAVSAGAVNAALIAGNPLKNVSVFFAVFGRLLPKMVPGRLGLLGQQPGTVSAGVRYKACYLGVLLSITHGFQASCRCFRECPQMPVSTISLPYVNA